MHAEFTFQLATLYGFLLALGRISGLMIFVPIPGFSAAPGVSRVVLALVLTIALYPVWPSQAVDLPASGLAVGRLLGWIAAEAALGITIGLAIAFLLEGVQMAAQILGLQAGYSYASTVDPSTQADTTTLQLMAQLLAGLLFLAFGFERQVLRVLAKSMESAPRGSFPLHGVAIEAILGLGAVIFSTGLELAIPVLALLILLDVAFAVLGRLHAQMQLLSLSFAVKMLVTLAFLASILSVYPDGFEHAGERTFRVLAGLLHN